MNMRRTKVMAGIVSVAVAVCLCASVAGCTVSGSTHSHTYTSSTTATCTEGGITTYTCTECGSTFTVETEALGHNLETTTQTATCTEAGSTTYTCTRDGCEYSETVSTPALGHSYEATASTATCTEGGTVTYTCSRCGDTYSETISDPAGHDFEETTTATCTEDGVTTYTCTVCGYSYEVDTPALGHDYKLTTTATCTGSGEIDGTCTRCGDTFTVEKLTSSGLGHDYVLSEHVDASCTESEYDVYKCLRCNDTYNITTGNPTGHAWTDDDWVVTSTETDDDGNTITNYERTCSVCGATETKYTTGTGEDVETVSEWDGETIDYGELVDLTSSTDEVTISTAAELAGLAAYTNGEYDTSDGADDSLSGVNIVLAENTNIDLQGEAWTPISKVSADNPYWFEGTFDGQGSTIYNLYSVGDTNEMAGLFGAIHQSDIENLNIVNAEVAGSVYVGAIAGMDGYPSGNNDEYSTIKNCTVSGDIKISGNLYVGGIVGLGLDTCIESCSVAGDEGSYISGTYLDSDYNGYYVGGIAGSIETQSLSVHSGTIHCSFKDVTVSGLTISGTKDVGGIVGYINDSYQQISYAIITTADADDTGTVNRISNCTISIVPKNAANSYASKAYAGILVGEANYGLTAIEYVTLENVVLNYSSTYTYGASDDTVEYRGYYGLIKGNSVPTFTSCTQYSSGDDAPYTINKIAT